MRSRFVAFCGVSKGTICSIRRIEVTVIPLNRYNWIKYLPLYRSGLYDNMHRLALNNGIHSISFIYNTIHIPNQSFLALSIPSPLNPLLPWAFVGHFSFFCQNVANALRWGQLICTKSPQWGSWKSANAPIIGQHHHFIFSQAIQISTERVSIQAHLANPISVFIHLLKSYTWKQQERDIWVCGIAVSDNFSYGISVIISFL